MYSVTSASIPSASFFHREPAAVASTLSAPTVSYCRSYWNPGRQTSSGACVARWTEQAMLHLPAAHDGSIEEKVYQRSSARRGWLRCWEAA